MPKPIRSFSKKAVAVFASVFLLSAAAVSGVIAFIIAEAPPIANTFSPAHVACAVQETFENNLKTNVCIKNTGDVDAYIRATVIVNWISEADNSTVLSTAPVSGSDYTVDWGDSGWTQSADGYWYYAQPIAPGASTDYLIDRCETKIAAPEGYQLSVQIIASAIQASPAEAVEEKWGVENQNGTIKPVDNAG